MFKLRRMNIETTFFCQLGSPYEQYALAPHCYCSTSKIAVKDKRIATSGVAEDIFT